MAAQDILLSGLKDFVYKSDGERSIVALKHEVVRKLRRDVGPIGVQRVESARARATQWSSERSGRLSR